MGRIRQCQFASAVTGCNSGDRAGIGALAEPVMPVTMPVHWLQLHASGLRVLGGLDKCLVVSSALGGRLRVYACLLLLILAVL
jgi:hypothetical protein